MLARVMSVGLLAGLLAGLLIAVLQQVTTTPLILLAETYETQGGASTAPVAGARSRAETVAAAALVPCAVFIIWNETLANWQALWFATALALVAFSLLRARVAPG